MSAISFEGVFGSSRRGSSGGAGGGLSTSEVQELIAASQLNRGFYNPDTVYSETQIAKLTHGYAMSRVNGNQGNDPLTDDGSNWILLLNGLRSVTYWVRNQTEELPTDELAANQTVTSEGIIGFTGTRNGDDSDNGGISGLTLLDIATAPNSDPVISLANSGLYLPAGEFQIEAQFYGNQTPDNDLHMRMMKVMENTDDIRRLVGTTRQSNYFGEGENNVHAHYLIQSEIKIAVATVFYFQLVNYAANRIVGFVKIKRVI